MRRRIETTLCILIDFLDVVGDVFQGVHVLTCESDAMSFAPYPCGP